VVGAVQAGGAAMLPTTTISRYILNDLFIVVVVSSSFYCFWLHFEVMRHFVILLWPGVSSFSFRV
jgi:dolichyl-phosphate-mannose--protein O-mannosyl transferase